MPTYRDLGKALADSRPSNRDASAPGRTGARSSSCSRGQRPATEALAATGPDLDPEDVRRFLGPSQASLEELWVVWDAVREALASDVEDERAGEGGSPASAVPDTEPVQVRRLRGAELS